MNAEQRQRASQLVRSQTEEEAIGEAFALLQELIDTPEPEPVGYTNETELDYVRKYEALPVSGVFWPTSDEDANIALYTAPPAPSVPDNVARDAARLDWLVERNAPHGLGWEIIQMPAGNVHIHTLFGDKAKFGSIRDAIDAAMSEKGQQT